MLYCRPLTIGLLTIGRTAITKLLLAVIGGADHDGSLQI